MVLLSPGCIQVDDGAAEGASVDGVTVVIQFDRFSPDTHPGARAVWSTDGPGEWGMELEGEGQEETVYVVHNVTGDTVLDVLVNATGICAVPVEVHREAMGAFVDAIDGLENGEEGHWWSYYLNDVYGTVASDAAPVEDGDMVRWAFIPDPFS